MAMKSIVRQPTRNILKIAIVAAIGIVVVSGAGAAAFGQKALVDDILLITQGQRKQEQSRTTQHLGPGVGTADNRLGSSPGSGEALLREQSDRHYTSMQNRDVLSAAVSSSQSAAMRSQLSIAPSAPLRAQTPTIYGQLEIPSADEEGPSNGLTLDSAIEQLTRSNYELQAKYREIPKATADVLSAGLRNNPLIFASADAVPYGSYSQQRPGENSYSATVIQPIDVGHKRRARLAVATRARDVIQAQYQDAVRLEIDNLYVAFIDVLAAREAVRYSEAGLAGLQAVSKTTENLVRGNEEPATALDRVQAQTESAEISLEQAKISLAESKQSLGLLLAIPDEAIESLDLRRTIRQSNVEIPPVDDLIGLALELRPDLNAYRLGIRRAQADVSLAQREAIPDFFVLYTPWGVNNNTPIGGQDATSWGIGGFTSVPLFNRNQGNIARARQSVSQTRIEANGIERRIVTEIRQAYLEYSSTSGAVQRLERSVLPKTRHVRDTKLGLLQRGQESAMGYFDAQREYNDVVRQYRETQIKRRRAVLRLNTVVGQRLFP